MKSKSRTPGQTPAHTEKPADLQRNQPELNLDELTGVVGGGDSATSTTTTTRLGPDIVRHKHLAGVKYE